ncbi:MAG: flagellar export chaperone FliS [Gammaproteobacteria bacterium]
MSRASAKAALSQYSKNAVVTGIESANPHRLIQMLMEGALDKIASARGHMQRNTVSDKCQKIGCAIAIIKGLRMSLDQEKGGEIAINLDDLYDYMERRLLEANRVNDVGLLDEVTNLLREIKEAWDAIAGHATA